MPLSLPPEILGQIVDSLYAEETSDEYEAKSPTLLNLLFTSRALRVCALRNLCRTVVVDCDDNKPNEKLRALLIPRTVHPGLGSITPFIRKLQINVRNCTSSPAGLEELSALLDFIHEQCPLQTLILEGTYCDDDRPESDSEYLFDWAELPSIIRGSIEALLQMPMLRSFDISAMSGFSKEIFGTGTPHVDSLEMTFSQVPLAPALKNLRCIFAQELGTPDQIDGLWNVCRFANQYLEELEIDDACLIYPDPIDIRNNPYVIPDSLHLCAVPKLRKFTYSHFHLGSRDHLPCPPVSFFQLENVVPEFQSFHLCIRMDKFYRRAARSIEGASSRVADPNWVILDSLLTSTNLPNFRHFHLVVEQDVNTSFILTFVPDADGKPSRLATKHALQCQIEDSLKPSFPHLTASTAIDFKLEAIVNLH